MTDGAGRLLAPLGARHEIRGALLVDGAGRIVDHVGFDDGSVRRQVASLVAGLHAAGARLSEAAGDPGPSRMRILAGESSFLLARIPPPAMHVLLLHVDGGGDGLNGFLKVFLPELADLIPEGPDVTDAGSFEASLEPER